LSIGRRYPGSWGTVLPTAFSFGENCTEQGKKKTGRWSIQVAIGGHDRQKKQGERQTNPFPAVPGSPRLIELNPKKAKQT
jgi:hypothetical protein